MMACTPKRTGPAGMESTLQVTTLPTTAQGTAFETCPSVSQPLHTDTPKLVAVYCVGKVIERRAFPVIATPSVTENSTEVEAWELVTRRLMGREPAIAL